MTAHALDYDDVGLTAINHPTVTNAPVVFALGEERGRNGKEILRAFTMAVEVQHKLAGALMPELTNRGWHTTSVFGTIGAAAAASCLLDLRQEEIENALGIAASLAGGLRANFGSFTKSLHAGIAAQNGILAAQLAQTGVTASPTAFEGEDGFALAYAGRRIEEHEVKLGSPWDAQFAGFQFKKYPVCSSSHTALDAFLKLQEIYQWDAEDIESVNAGMSEFAFRNLIFSDPQTPQQAKFSMPYAIACAAVKGGVTLEDFDPEAIFDDRVRAFMPKVAMTLDEAFQNAGILSNEPAIVSVVLKDGRRLKERVDYALGTIKNPMSKERLKAKFDSCLKRQDRLAADRAFDNIFALERFENVKDFLENLPE